MFVINLETTVFQLSEIVHDLPSTFLHNGNGWYKVKDFGTVLVGNVTEEDKEQLFDPQWGLASAVAPVFTVPVHWRMPQVLKALGAFESATQASKNGWNKDIVGKETIGWYDEHIFRINKQRGILSTFKKI
jgi:hypothetical protein